MLLTAPAVHILFLASATALTAVLSWYAWRRRDRPGALPFALLMLVTTIWSAVYAVGLLTLSSRWLLFWQGVVWLSITTIPVWFLLFALEYTGNDDLATPRITAGLLVIPAVTLLLVWTSGVHELIWTENRVVVVDGLAMVVESYGPWFWVFFAYGYVLIVLAAALIVRLVFFSDTLFADQSALLLIGTVAPLAGNVFSVFAQNKPLPGIDFTPYGLTVTGIAFGYALFRRRLFDLVPAAYRFGRDAAIRDLQDGVFILDTDRQIIYCNPAAAELFDCDAEDVLGEAVTSLIDDDALDFDTDDGLAELDRGSAVYEIRNSQIRDRRDRLVGHTLVVQDITARKSREQQAARQRAELERLEDLNAVIRSVNRALVSTTSREEIERAVCDRLADSERYLTVCVADMPTWNGDAARWSVAGEAEAEGVSSLPEAFQESDAPDEPETPVAADTENSTWTIVPIVYGRTVYGAVGLCLRDDPDTPVSERERAVLAELGELIGHAIDAVENRRLLAAESVVELDLRSPDDGALLAVTSRLGCQLELSGLVPDAVDGHLAYLRVTGTSPGAVADALESTTGSRAREIRADVKADGGSGLVEWVMTTETLLGTLVERGGQVLGASADGETARYRVEVASDAEVRTLIDRVQQAYPETRLAAKREHSRPVERGDTIPEDAIEDLTDRQQEAIEAAYRAGYYSWPRESTAEDIAETLDIAPPTLHAHLRKAEHSLLADLFDQERSRGD